MCGDARCEKKKGKAGGDTHDKWKVDLRLELHRGCSFRILWPAVDEEREDAVLNSGVQRPKDCALPMRQADVVRVDQTEADGPIRGLSLLHLLELVEQDEVARHDDRLARGGHRGLSSCRRCTVSEYGVFRGG